MNHNWQKTTLGEVSRIVGRIGFRGYRRDDYVNSEADGAISLSPSNIVNSKLDFSNCTYITWEKYNESPEIMIYPQDIILVKTASVGKCAIVKNIPHECTINPQFVVLKDIAINQDFLYYQILSSSFQSKLKAITSGTSVPTLSQKNLANVDLFYPCIEEQLRIVNELDAIVLLRELLLLEKTNLGLLELSIFYDSFGNPVTNPKDWQTFSLSDITSLITDGSHYSPKNDEMGTIPMLSVKNMGTRGFDYTDCKMISQEEYVKLEAAGCKPMPDDVLVAKDGSYFKKIFVHQSEAPQAILSSIAIVRPDQSKVTPEFLCSLLSTPDIYNLVEERYLTGTAIKRVILKGLRQLKIIVPPIEIQKQFSEKIWRINAQRNLIEESVVEAQKLFDSRMNYYFGD